jgi:hypothetical protein
MTPTEASTKITAPIASTVLISTTEFAQKQYGALHWSRRIYTVIICGQFCGFIRPPHCNTYFASVCDLPYKFGDYHRGTYIANAICRSKV